MKFKQLYSQSKPFDSGTLRVSKLHTLYYEQVGNPKGKPAVVLHGGPGTGISVRHHRLFNPRKYRIVLFDQRGCGKSTPHLELRENTVEYLVEDTEKLRKHLNIEKWLVVGGSWGSTLALSYATKHPKRVSGLVLWAILLGTKKEWQWIFQDGANRFFPEHWEKFVNSVPRKEQSDLIKAYKKRLSGKQPNKKLAQTWDTWESLVMMFHESKKTRKQKRPPKEEIQCMIATACFENHYASKDYFLLQGGLLKQMHRIKSIEGIVIQGRYDMICPPRNAWTLHQSWPKSELRMVHYAGHASREPELTDAIVRALEEFARS